MKIKQTKPNIWEFAKDGVDFTFRFWEDDLRALNPEDDNNASLKFRECKIHAARWDLKIDEAILKDEKQLSIYLEHLADSEIAWLKLRNEIT